jgi:opacity protein-like surface antigen
MVRRSAASDNARGIVAAAVFVFLACVASIAHGEDSDRVRFYLGLRGQDSNPGAGVHDAWGLSLGANLGKYWGVEMSADAYELRVKGGGARVGEYGVVALVPQLRLRYPFFGDRLVPYIVGGVGVGLTEFNDRKPPGFGVSIQDKSSSVLVGTLGGGLEYFIADNIAVGAEAKYVLAGDTTIRINGTPRDQKIQSPLFSVALRMFVPELRPAPMVEHDQPIGSRLYFGVRAGAAFTTDRSGFQSLTLEPEPPAYFSEGNQLFGALLGLDLGRHWGVELAAEGYEARLADSTLGSPKEVAIVTVIPHVRWRYPLWGGRLVPFVSAGVGLGHVELNDSKPPSLIRNPQGSSFGVAAAVGGGVEYFVASNISVGLDARYQTSRGHTFQLDGRDRDAHADAVILALTLRAYVWKFDRP